MRRKEPFVQRNVRPLENGSGSDRELVAAVVAKPHAGLRLAGHLVDVEGPAKWAISAIRPAVGLHVRGSLFFSSEDRVCEIAGHRRRPLTSPNLARPLC